MNLLLTVYNIVGSMFNIVFGVRRVSAELWKITKEKRLLIVNAMQSFRILGEEEKTYQYFKLVSGEI
jgi:hypothetical protein